VAFILTEPLLSWGHFPVFKTNLETFLPNQRMHTVLSKDICTCWQSEPKKFENHLVKADYTFFITTQEIPLLELQGGHLTNIYLHFDVGITLQHMSFLLWTYPQPMSKCKTKVWPAPQVLGVSASDVHKTASYYMRVVYFLQKAIKSSNAVRSELRSEISNRTYEIYNLKLII